MSADMDAKGLAGERLAQRFHEAYERLAPSFGYETRRESAKPWADVPEQNRRLMIAVCSELLDALPGQEAAATPGAAWGLVCKMLPGALLFAEEAEHLDDARRRAHAILCDFLALPAPSLPGGDKP